MKLRSLNSMPIATLLTPPTITRTANDAVGGNSFGAQKKDDAAHGDCDADAVLGIADQIQDADPEQFFHRPDIQDQGE